LESTYGQHQRIWRDRCVDIRPGILTMNFLEYLLSRQLQFDDEGWPGTKYLICVFLPFPTSFGFVVGGAYTF
jgi:hypothetical protein